MSTHTCRDKILKVITHLESTGRQTFSPDDVVMEMKLRGSPYAESTIRTHVVSWMCADAPGHHGVTYDDLERVGRGLYRRRRR